MNTDGYAAIPQAGGLPPETSGRDDCRAPQERRRWAGISALWLVATAFVIVQLIVVPLWLPLGWDEGVYVSQVSSRVPTTYFSAPRARGISWLAAPAVVLSSSTVVLRAWMLALSTAGLVAAFWPWRRLMGDTVTAVAAAMLAGLWVVQFYAAEVMPNLYVAYGAVAAAGWFLRVVSSHGGRTSVALALSIAFTALMRPADAVFIAAVLTAGTVVVRSWRRWAAAVAVLTGLCVGLLPWLIEAYARYGSPLARLREGSDVQGGMHLSAAFGMQLRALNGPLLCRPCHSSWSYPLLSGWWLVLPVLVVSGLALAARKRRAEPVRFTGLVLATVCAAAVSVQYLLLLDYAAPRFLIPAYALLALPVAALVVSGVGAVSRRRRPVVVGALVAVFVMHVASQLLVLDARANSQVRSRTALQDLAQRLHRTGLRPPCTLVGSDVVPLAFHAGCRSEALTGNNASITMKELLRRTAVEPVAAAGNSPHAPRYAQRWARCWLMSADGTPWYVFIAPSPGVRPGHC
ncbi:ArnT family glycosyltransferase [Streptomyces sp. NPDC048248]|uniref:ArnT family glycosyltransferase n=1 Tax=Streptomyces sp. NPDC048248 TaxID=3365523 RepID=UPI00371E9518